MTSTGAWGAIPQAEGVAHTTAGEVMEKVRSNESNDEADPQSTESSSSEFDKERVDYQVTKLARQITQHSIKSTGGTYPNPFQGSSDPSFRSTLWPIQAGSVGADGDGVVTSYALLIKRTFPDHV